MATAENVKTAHGEFRALLDRCKGVTFHEHELLELQSRKAIRVQSWAGRAGVYVLLHGDHVRYVGRALKGQGLGGRLWQHVRDNPDFRTGVEGRATPRVAILALDDDDAWLAPSLELLLHWRTRGDGDLLNKKRC